MFGAWNTNSTHDRQVDGEALPFSDPFDGIAVARAA
jgi:hypothetical protein